MVICLQIGKTNTAKTPPGDFKVTMWTTKFLVSPVGNSFTNANLFWWLCGTILCDYKRVILWFDLLKRLVDWICSNLILTMNTRFPSIWLKNGSKIAETELQWISGYELVRNPLFFAFFVFFVCSSSSKVCGGSSSGLWRLGSVELHWFVICWYLRTLLAWFPQTLGSRQMIWMILLWMFSDFGVEVLEVLEGFEAWFLQSFFTSESWSP